MSATRTRPLLSAAAPRRAGPWSYRSVTSLAHSRADAALPRTGADTGGRRIALMQEWVPGRLAPASAALHTCNASRSLGPIRRTCAIAAPDY